MKRTSSALLLASCLGLLGVVLAPAAAGASAVTSRLDSLSGLQIVGGTGEIVAYRGRSALHLSPPPGGGAGDKAVIAIVGGTDFRDGTIEVDVAGAPRAGASADSRGFIGVEFRLSESGARGEVFYLRPTNGRAGEQLRRNRSVQYESLPEFPWHRLRKESPGVYESYADLETGAWTKMRIVVSGTTARLYVGGAGQPSLVVNDLKLGDTHGPVALWAHTSTDGYFSNLKVEPSRASRPDAAKRLSLDDLEKIVRLASPRISPDGRSIAVVLSRADAAKNKWVPELDLVDVATGARRTLTRDRKGISHPRWSPTGDRLAFLAAGGPEKDSQPQIWVLPMAGGDAHKVTGAPAGVQHFTWRPDGKAFAFAAEDERPNKAEVEKGHDLFEVGNDNLFVTEAPMPVHAWLVAVEGGEARRLTSGSWSLPAALPPNTPSAPLSWSPDGKSLAFVRVETPHSGDSDAATVRVLDVESGAIRALTGKTRFEGYPVFSPDGTKLSYWCPRDRDPNNVNDVHVTSVATGGEGTNLTRPIDRCLYASVWTPDGKALLVGGNDGTRVSLWIAPLDGPAKRLELGDVMPAWSFFVDATVGADGSISFVGSEPGRPPELWTMASPSAAPRRLTDLNAEIAGRDLGRVETFAWQGPDGFKEDGVVVLPPGLAPGAKVPLLLYIHGGPQAASTRAFSAPAQLFAAQGWAVFMPNYRGSDNLGNAYQRAIFNDAGDGPGRDVLAGVDALVKRGFVDPARIAVSGWSYGGYMTAWLIGHDTRWKAAVAGAAVTDLADQYTFADFNVQMRYAMKGNATPFSPGGEALYRAQSPIAHAARAKTPTLIISDTGDFRVPHTQSFKLFRALKEAGVETSFVAIPVGGHFPGDPVRAREVFRRWIDWLQPRLK